MMRIKGERTILTREEALSVLDVKGDQVHCFANSAPGVMIGADWDVPDVASLFERFEVELAGEAATAIDHGVVVSTQRYFFATDKARLEGLLAKETEWRAATQAAIEQQNKEE